MVSNCGEQWTTPRQALRDFDSAPFDSAQGRQGRVPASPDRASLWSSSKNFANWASWADTLEGAALLWRLRPRCLAEWRAARASPPNPSSRCLPWQSARWRRTAITAWATSSLRQFACLTTRHAAAYLGFGSGWRRLGVSAFRLATRVWRTGWCAAQDACEKHHGNRCLTDCPLPNPSYPVLQQPHS